MRSCGQGDELRRVYRQHVDAVFGFLACSVSRDVAEELTAATFERVIRSWRRYDSRRASERVWILAIARNLLTDHYRRESHRAGPSLDASPELLERAVDPSTPLDTLLEADELRRWLALLGERERTVVALRFGADMTARQVAQTLELSVANVHQIASRALRTLREAAEPAGLSDSAAAGGERPASGSRVAGFRPAPS